MTATVHTVPGRATDRYAWYLFSAYALLYVAAAYLTNEFVLTESLLEKDWSKTFDLDRVAGMLEHRRRWALIGYGAVPLTLSLKMLFASLCIATGCAVAGWSVRFRDVFRTAVDAEIVFATAALIHLVWSLFGQEFSSLSEYAGFYPLSALHFVSIDSSKLWMAYPLKTLNAFEIVYIGALSLGMERVLRQPAPRVFALVASSYGIGLLLLVAAVTFLSLYLL